MPTTQNNEGKFVDRVEMAIMQFVLLHKAQQGEVTRDNLQQTFRGNLQMQGDHFDHCIRTLVQEGHLREAGGNKYTVTDDGREDVQKLQHLFLEIPNIVQQGGQSQGQGGQQKQGMAQQRGVGGSTTSGGSGGSGGSTGTTMGGQGNVGSSSRQGGDAGREQPSTSGGSNVNKGGANNPGGNRENR